MVDVRGKKPLLPVFRSRLENLAEGRCAQILPTGPFLQEGATIAWLYTHANAYGGRRGRHHEIYLSGIRLADPEKCKTVLCQPID
jgi:hypothetical protein